MRDVVFIGPSVEADVVAEHFSGVVRPPIRRGDLTALTEAVDPPAAVGIVDGRFLQELAVSPKEVVAALDVGIAIFGSSSMGALRATECAAFGAVGVGRIFELYATKIIEADDEVALVYDPSTGRALSEPLVNFRLAVAEAVDRGQLSPRTATTIVDAAAGLYFPDRSYANLVRVMSDRPPAVELAAFRSFVARPDKLDQKRVDALALLDQMSAASRRRRGLAVESR